MPPQCAVCNHVKAKGCKAFDIYEELPVRTNGSWQHAMEPIYILHKTCDLSENMIKFQKTRMA